MDNVVIFDNFTPSAGLNAYWVTVGPIFTSDISTGIPKFSRVFLISIEFSFILPEVGGVSFLESKSNGGSVKLPLETTTGFFSFVSSNFSFLNKDILGDKGTDVSDFSSSVPFILKEVPSRFLSICDIKDGRFSSSNFSLGISFLINCKNIKKPIKIMAEKIILAAKSPKPPTNNFAIKNPVHPPCILVKS